MHLNVFCCSGESSGEQTGIGRFELLYDWVVMSISMGTEGMKYSLVSRDIIADS